MSDSRSWKSFSYTSIRQRMVGLIKRQPLVATAIAVVSSAVAWATIPVVGIVLIKAGVTVFPESGWSVATTLTSTLSTGFGLACCMAIVAGDAREQAPTPGNIMGYGLSRTVPATGALLLYYLLCGIALIFLVVPGVILAVRYMFVVPVLLQERTGLQTAFKRSADLTQGHRWWLFGATLLFGIIVTLGTALILFLVSFAVSFLIGKDATTALDGVIAAVSLGLVGALTCYATVAAYVEVSGRATGLPAQQAATVFE